MKKTLLFLSLAIWSCFIMAQDTLTGWTFPVNTGTDSLNANLGTTQNKGYDLRFQWVTPNDTTMNTIFFTNGATSLAAATTGWDNGADDKYWSIKFKASGYTNFKVSSVQNSDYTGYSPGPGAFKLQWRLSSGTFADIPGGTVQVANNWTTGKVDTLSVPITGQGTSSIYIRWISATNNDYLGNTLTANGISMIDDILVTAKNASGTNDIVFTNRINVYPVPNKGKFTVDSKVPLSSLEILDMTGRTISSVLHPALTNSINLGGISKGTYLVRVGFTDTEKRYTMKFQVD
jgi:hypothetical protein